MSFITNDAKATEVNSTTLILNTQHAIPLKVAQQLATATATQAACTENKFPVTVSVLNRDGVDIVLARGDDICVVHLLDFSIRTSH